MSRPDDIPQDVWDTAFAAMPPINQEAYDSSPFAQGLHVGFARAILAERERCAKIADENMNYGPLDAAAAIRADHEATE